MGLVSKMEKIQGIGASSGIGIGQVHVIKSFDFVIAENSLETVSYEIELFNQAIESAKTSINSLYNKAVNTLGEDDAKIFESHLMFLEDPEYVSGIIELISVGKTAAFAISVVRDNFVSLFSLMDDDYMKERASDIKDVSDRLINILLGVESADIAYVEPVIIVAEDLTPSMTVSLDPKKVLAFVTRVGGKTSHSAIMARNMGIPAIVGVGDLTLISAASMLIVDGDSGEITVNPSASYIAFAEKKRSDFITEQILLQSYIGRPTLTSDGKHIELVCNIGSDKDIPLVVSNDGEGVGLFRSEFLYMGQTSMPSEELQFQAYKKVLEGIAGPIIIRTLDVGGDKDIPYIHLDDEMNPFLGVRAIRLCLKDHSLFQPQLLALLRASVFGHLKIMFPMVSSLEEVHLIKDQLTIAKATLDARGESYNPSVEIGIMIEIPAAAIMADVLATEVDFFSIGTNDLVQYTTATDRINQNVSHLYTHYHPAVLRLVKFVTDAANKAGISVGMCGEAASDELLLPFLIGSGLHELSVSPSKVLSVRKSISNLSTDLCGDIVKKIMSLPDATTVREYLESVASKA